MENIYLCKVYIVYYISELKVRKGYCATLFTISGVSSYWVLYFTAVSLSTCTFAVCHGAVGEETQAKEVFLEVPQLVRKKSNQIEAFVLKRVWIFYIFVSSHWEVVLKWAWIFYLFIYTLYIFAGTSKIFFIYPLFML